MRRIELTSALLLLLVAPPFAQQAPKPEPVHCDRHRVVHHFYLYADGGMMTLTVGDPSDPETRKAVRAYVQRVSQLMVMGDIARLRSSSFLPFQITDLNTGDSMEVREREATFALRVTAPETERADAAATASAASEPRERSEPSKRRARARVGGLRGAKPLGQEWRARQDSNLRPLAPEANALSS